MPVLLLRLLQVVFGSVSAVKLLLLNTCVSKLSCSLRFYADDTTGYSSNLCPSTLQINLQNNVGLIASWFCENFLAINHSKSQSIVFNRATLPMPFVIDSNELDYVTQIKLLGVVSNNSLSFNVHIKEVCQKVNTKVSILRRIRKFIPLIDCLRRVIENCKY